MADVKLKDNLGEEQIYEGVESVALPRADGEGTVEFVLPPTLQEKAVTITENGTTEITGDEGYAGLSKVSVTANVESKEAVAVFGDAEGSGCVIFLPEDSGVEIYTKCGKIGIVDASYAEWIYAITPSSPTVLAALDAFVARLVANPEKFNSIFSGGAYTMFMDELHGCNTPDVSALSAPTWAAFANMLRNTLSGYNWLSLEQGYYTNGYEGDYYSLSSSAKASFPYAWYPAVKNGTIQRGLIPNTPTGTMPRYATIYKAYGSGLQQAFFVNAAAALGIAYDCVAMPLSFGALVVYSYGAQTLAKEMLEQMMGGTWDTDVSLAEGWNRVESGGAASPITLEELQAAFKVFDFYFNPSEIDYDEMSDYEKSAFAPYYTDLYKRVGNASFTVALNVVCEDTTNS